MTANDNVHRRQFLHTAAVACGVLPFAPFASANEGAKTKQPVCAFVKFLQSLSYDELAETIARLGFDGIEATVRDGGQVLPERVEEDLPKLVEALNKHNLEITVMASSVNRADHPLTEKVLRTAAGLGVKRYRMQYYRYDLSQSVRKQLDELKPAARDLADMNRDIGISAVYQNHSGAKVVGASVWDLHLLLEGIPADEIGIAFDIRHATVEGGQAWPVSLNVMRDRLKCVYVKDFQWNGRRPKNVPLGKGQVDPNFFKQLRTMNYHGPISLHVEYLGDAGVQKNIDALDTDLTTLRKLLDG